MNVKMVVMDMNPAFKAAVKELLDRPVIIADRFHYCSYIHWAVDEVRHKVQMNGMHMIVKNRERMRYVLHIDKDKLTKKNYGI